MVDLNYERVGTGESSAAIRDRMEKIKNNIPSSARPWPIAGSRGRFEGALVETDGWVINLLHYLSDG